MKVVSYLVSCWFYFVLQNLLGGVKPQGAKSSTAPILDDTTTEDELEMALAPKHHNKHQPMKVKK